MFMCAEEVVLVFALIQFEAVNLVTTAIIHTLDAVVVSHLLMAAEKIVRRQQ
jgi:hypothetical protein